MFGTNRRRSEKMGNTESKERKTQKSDTLPLHQTAIQDHTITSTDENKSRHSMELVSTDAVPVSNTDSGFVSEKPIDTSSKLEIAEYVNRLLDKKFEPFKKDITESKEELKKKIELYQDYMKFELSFGYHDAMILYHDKDEEDVIKFRDSIKKNMVLNDKQKPRIELFPRIANALGSRFKGLEFGIERCTFVMLYVTSNFVNDQWSEFSSEACLMEAIYTPEKRWCVVPVFSEDKSSTSYRVPMSINTLKGVRYSNEEDDFYLVSIKTLFNDRISVRKLHEKEHWQKKKKWVLEFEAIAREEALEELKREKARKEEHEAFLRSQNEIQSSPTYSNKANLINEFVDICKPNELSFAQKNEQILKHPSKNVSNSLPISRPDERRDSGTSVDPEDIVPDTPSSVTSAPFLGRETLEQCAPAASSCYSRPSQKPYVTASGSPPVFNVAGCPQRSSSDQTSCPVVATSEGIASKNSNPSTPGSQPALHPSASSESLTSGQRTKTNSQSKSVGKANVCVPESCIDHPLSEKSDPRTEVHHHYYYTQPPVYNIKAENVQIGTKNKLYNTSDSQSFDSDNDYEEQPNCETLTKEKDNSSSSDEWEDEKKTDEPNSFSNSNVSTPSQDGAQSTGSQNADSTEKTVLQDYGINLHKPLSTNTDEDQTESKEIVNTTSDNGKNEDIEQTNVKEI